MARHYGNWLETFMEYASFSEAPRHMHFWVGVSTIAGALRRKVWLDMKYFKWTPCFYVVLVAPPGIVSKSTTAAIGMDLLNKVPEVRFGPSIVTWQALVTAFAESTTGFQIDDQIHSMSALTLESSEFGNLLNPRDTEMVDLLVSLWDSKTGAFEKKTKGSGTDTIVNPWINLLACTTPAWIAGNFPEYMIGGGFTSRCIFVYADKKAKYVAYPGFHVPTTMATTAQRLIDDLTDISLISGEYTLSPDARRWGEAWYERHYASKNPDLDDDRFGGYFARKQTHIHKLAMVLAAAESSHLVITPEHLALAETMVTDLEPDMQFVFSKIGKTEESLYSERMIWFVHTHGPAGVSYQDVYRFVHAQFPKLQDFEAIVAGAVRAGYMELKPKGSEMFVLPLRPLESASNGVEKVA